jgi:SPP1 Gp6-like portal protein
MALLDAAAQTLTAILDQFQGRPGDPLATSLMQAALGNEAARRGAMDAAWKAYAGDFPLPLAPRKNTPRGQDIVRVNRTAPLVAASVHFLFGTPPTYALPAPPVDPALPTPPPDPALVADAAWMDAVQAANRWDSLLLDWATNGAICGHGYLRLVPPETPILEPDDWAAADDSALPRVIVLDPLVLQKITDPRDTTRTTAYVWTWQQGRVDATGTTRAARQLIEEHPTHAGWWLITDQESAGAGGWVTTQQTEWPFPFPPIVDCKNLPNPNAVYGAPDVTPSIIEINKAVNFVLSNTLRIYRLHSHPKLWASGMAPESKLDAAPDSVWYLPAPDSQVGQLVPAVNPAAGESALDALDASLYQESQTPGLVLGQVEAGQLPPSGAAQRMALQPLIMKTLAKRTLYGPALAEVWRRLFVISGRAPRRVTVGWPDVLPSDPLALRQALKIDVETLGVSLASAQAKAGYDPAVEAAQKADEATDVGGVANPTGTLAPGAQGPPDMGAPPDMAGMPSMMDSMMSQEGM